MGKRFSSSFDSDNPVEQVYEVLTEEDWARTKAEHLGDDSQIVRREVAEGHAVTLVLSRQLPSGVPGFLAKFLPDDQRVTTTDVWQAAGADGARRGTWSAHIDGAPAKMGGTMRIEPLPTGSRYTIEGEVKVSVPIIGGKAESFIAEQVVRLAEKEADVVAKVLA